VSRYLSSNYWFKLTTPGERIYTIGMVVYILLVIFFAYFYTAITFNPLEISENLKKQGGYMPGIRPGKPTSDYITSILNKVVFIGASLLALVACLPFVFSGLFNANVSFGGTSLIIIVSVILDTAKQLESQMLVRNYKGFLSD
ncbi:MAG: preprotein translocase subunit SecY, partial [Lachnospiraceae bacterium]|nr:preprotein translocase subunit SecY [Lachnospiraceae bacterium]